MSHAYLLRSDKKTAAASRLPAFSRDLFDMRSCSSSIAGNGLCCPGSLRMYSDL